MLRSRRHCCVNVCMTWGWPPGPSRSLRKALPGLSGTGSCAGVLTLALNTGSAVRAGSMCRCAGCPLTPCVSLVCGTSVSLSSARSLVLSVPVSVSSPSALPGSGKYPCAAQRSRNRRTLASARSSSCEVWFFHVAHRHHCCGALHFSVLTLSEAVALKSDTGF